MPTFQSDIIGQKVHDESIGLTIEEIYCCKIKELRMDELDASVSLKN